jgi:hypothetical protein
MSIGTLIIFGLIPYLATEVLIVLDRKTVRVESGCPNSFSTPIKRIVSAIGTPNILKRC